MQSRSWKLAILGAAATIAAVVSVTSCVHTQKGNRQVAQATATGSTEYANLSPREGRPPDLVQGDGRQRPVSRHTFNQRVMGAKIKWARFSIPGSRQALHELGADQ